MRRATRQLTVALVLALISIHALLTEGDQVLTIIRGVTHISIHTLLAEGDVLQRMGVSDVDTFLSTPSLRRATIGSPTVSIRLQISIHTLLAEGDRPGSDQRLDSRAISIHTLLAEGDKRLLVALGTAAEFLSTPSLRRATL